MNTEHRVTAVLKENGTLSIDYLPFAAGELVEIVIKSLKPPTDGPVFPPPSLAGSVLWYHEPFEPACDPHDWNAMK